MQHFFFFFFLNGHAGSLWKFLGQGWNLHLCADPSHCGGILNQLHHSRNSYVALLRIFFSQRWFNPLIKIHLPTTQRKYPHRNLSLMHRFQFQSIQAYRKIEQSTEFPGTVPSPTLTFPLLTFYISVVYLLQMMSQY